MFSQSQLHSKTVYPAGTNEIVFFSKHSIISKKYLTNYIHKVINLKALLIVVVVGLEIVFLLSLLILFVGSWTLSLVFLRICYTGYKHWLVFMILRLFCRFVKDKFTEKKHFIFNIPIKKLIHLFPEIISTVTSSNVFHLI